MSVIAILRQLRLQTEGTHPVRNEPLDEVNNQKNKKYIASKREMDLKVPNRNEASRSGAVLNGEVREYARQKAHNPLTSNQPWHARTLKRNVRREGHVRGSFFANPFKYASTTAIASSRDIHASVESTSSIPFRKELRRLKALSPVSAFSELALYHSGRRSDVAQFQVGSFPEPLRKLQAQMKDLVRLCSRSEIIGFWPDGIGISDISPVQADADLEQHLLREIEEMSPTQ